MKHQRVHLVSMLGGDVTVVPQMIDHYRGLGIESFKLIRHAESTSDSVYEQTAQIVEESGVSLTHTHVGPWDEDLNSRLIEAVMAEDKDDWFVIADLDEFQLHDRPLPDLIDYCEHGSFDLVEGCYLDRLAPHGELPAVTFAGSLWEQFPLAGGISFPLLGATPTKVLLARGWVQLELGHHTAKTGRAVPHREAYGQVHHFKWNDSVVSRTQTRKQRFQSGTWKLFYPSVISESIRLLDHIQAHDGRIDVDEPLFMFHDSGPDYAAYPYWDRMKQWVHLVWPAGW